MQDNLIPTTLGINIGLSVVSFASVVLRLYTRARILKFVGLDDCMSGEYHGRVEP